MPPSEHLPATFILHVWEMIDMIVAIHWLLQVQLFSALFPLLQLPTDFATHRVWRDCKWFQISHNPKRKLYFENPNWYKKTLLKPIELLLIVPRALTLLFISPCLHFIGQWAARQTDRHTHTLYLACACAQWHQGINSQHPHIYSHTRTRSVNTKPSIESLQKNSNKRVHVRKWNDNMFCYGN